MLIYPLLLQEEVLFVSGTAADPTLNVFSGQFIYYLPPLVDPAAPHSRRAIRPRSLPS